MTSVEFDLNFHTVGVLAEAVFNAFAADDGSCTYCPVHPCQHRDNPEMFGTECVSVIRTWAQEKARLDYAKRLPIEAQCICLVDSHHGIYIPQAFIKSAGDRWVLNVENDVIRDIQEGPDAEFYWESWDALMANAYFIDHNCFRWTLMQEQDLFMVIDGYYEAREEDERP